MCKYQLQLRNIAFLTLHYHGHAYISMSLGLVIFSKPKFVCKNDKLLNIANNKKPWRCVYAEVNQCI